MSHLRRRAAAALLTGSALAAAAGLLAGPASAAVPGRAAQTGATRVSVTPDSKPGGLGGMFNDLADCLTAGWGGYEAGIWDDSYQCVPENFLGTVYWQLYVNYDYGS